MAASATVYADLALAAIRLECVKATKRRDLITSGSLSTNTDNGMNYYINEAQMLLDLMVETPKLWRRHKVKLASAAGSFEVQGLMEISTLAIIDDTLDTWTDLTDKQMSLAELRTWIGKPLADRDSSTPCYWALNIIGQSPTQLAITAAANVTAGVTDDSDIHFVTTSGGVDTYDFGYEGIVFDCLADQVYNIDLWAKFHSMKLSSDTDKSLWTVKYPMALILMTKFVLEGRMSSVQGARDAMAALQPLLDGIDNETVEYELGGRLMIPEG